MKVKKEFLKLFSDVIGATTPRFVEARFRDKFSKKLYEAYKEFEDDRLKLCEELANKDKDNKPEIKDGAYQFSDKNREIFEKEFKILRDELANLPLEGDEQDRLVNLIESTNYLPREGEAMIIDEEIIGGIHWKSKEKEADKKKDKKKDKKNK